MVTKSKPSLMFVFGTRPEAIKLSPVIKEFKKSNKFIIKVCITGQHREMLDQVLSLFQIKPDFDLNLMRQNQNLYYITARILINIRKILVENSPDLIFVQGDTATAFAASLASYYEKIPVAHIEAGLRTYNIYSPYPEELYRQLISKIASFHFSPTNRAKVNLLNEGIDERKIFVTGNTGIDALFSVLDMLKKNSFKINGYEIRDKKIILVTTHRRENLGEGLKRICLALKKIARKYSDVDIVYPVHPNPKIMSQVYSVLKGVKNIFLLNPLDYLSLIFLMNNAYLIMTDSGGIQEEAPSLGKPVLILRNVTERVEVLESEVAILVGTNIEKILNEVQKLLYDYDYYTKFSKKIDLFGDGNASAKILNIIIDHFKL